jgi:hypothetical protein
MDETSPTDVPSKGKARKAASAEESKVEKRPTSWVVPVVTAAILVSAFCIYYFVYVSAQREYLTNRNFRALATLGDQLQTVISVHGSILEFYADLEEKRHGPGQREKQDVNTFLVVQPADAGLAPPLLKAEAEKDYLRYLAPNFTIVTDQVTKVNEHELRLKPQRRDGRWELVLTAQHESGDKNSYIGSLDLSGLLKPLVGSLPFDEILLASDDGTIVYQSKKNGPQFTALSSLLQTQPMVSTTTPSSNDAGASPAAAREDSDDQPTSRAAAPWRSNAMNVTDAVVAGTRYKLFLQPILIDVFSDEPKPDQKARKWVLCGMKSAAGLQWESLSISYIFIIWFTIIFFVVAMSSPILKILFLNHRERLRLRELGFLGLFLVLLTGVFTLSGLQLVEFPLNDDTEPQLQQLGTRLSRAVRTELLQMRDQLKLWCDDPNLAKDLNTGQVSEVIRNAKARTLKPIDKTPDAPVYPYITNAFWTNDEGHQIVKWSLSGYLTPMIDVSSLPIYTNQKTIYLDGRGPAFYFDSILPPNKLEYLAALAINTGDCVTTLPDIRGDMTGGTAFLSAQPLSLIDPILPFGYGFALVDQTGLIIFHSDKTKNKRENFLQESDWSRQLYSATFGHATPQSLPIKYLGRDYRAVVTPIPGISQSPWSLIVYTDLTPARTVNLQVMTMASTLFLWILAVPVVAMALWGIIHRPQFAPEWLWPNRARVSAYGYLVYLYSLLIVSFLLLAFSGSGEQTVVACVAIPYLALLLTWWCFRLYPSSMEQPFAPNATSSLAAPAIVSMLGAIPFLCALVLQWDHLKPLMFLLLFGIAGVVPLLNRPRHNLTNWFNHRYPVEPLAEEDSGLAQQGLTAYRNGYVLSVLLLLLLVGVLTPAALFNASLNVERRLGIKQAQLHLASSLGARLLRAEEQCERGDLGEKACAGFQPGGDAWAKLVFDPLFGDRVGLPVTEHSAAASGNELYSGWFQTLIYGLHHDYNDSAAEMLGVIRDRNVSASGDRFPDWSWTNGDTPGRSPITLRWHGIQLLKSDDPAAARKSVPASMAEKDLLIQSPVPAIKHVGASGFAVAAGVMLVIGILFWTLARKMFLFHVAPMRITGAREVAEAIHEGRNIVVLLPPVSDWRLDAPKWTLDLATVASEPDWAEAFNLDKVPLNAVVEIRHFESSTNNVEIDNQKFILLQRLLAKEQLQLAVVMIVPASSKDYRRMFPAFEVIDLRDEPFYWLKQYEGPAQELIWKECGPLAALWPIGAQLAKDIRNEPVHSEDTIASEILERADPYYHLIWKECSKEQKFVLSQLAQDGIPNPTNGRAIGQLMRRGLIVKAPQFRIMNESFRRFLASAATTQLKREWLNDSRRTGWGKLHGAFFTTMIILGAFLLTTQNVLWQSSAAYVTTALGALGTLAKMLNTFRGGGGTTDKTS